ncbi:hypothetical protein PSN01_06062 [Micromonospora saelicesensis]|nr:hypothetical protein PSN01_06062 [Micromonospora saelicesensis]
MFDHVAGDRAAGRAAVATPGAAGAQTVGGPEGVVQGVADRAGVTGDPTQQRVAVFHDGSRPPRAIRGAGLEMSQAEQGGHSVALLGDQPVDPSTDLLVQRVAGVQQAQVGGAYGGTQRVGDAGGGDRPQQPHVTQTTGGLLEVALQQERQLTVGLPTGFGDLPQAGQVPDRGAPPVIGGGADQRVGQRLVPHDQPGVEQPEGDLDVVLGHRERLGDGADGMVEPQARVPDRVPDRGGQLVRAGHPGVQQHQVEVAVRGTLPPTQAPDGQQCHPVPRRQQPPQKRVVRGGPPPPGRFPDPPGNADDLVDQEVRVAVIGGS